MNPAEIIADLWRMMGPRARKVTVGIVSTSVVVLIVMFAYLAYSTGEVYRRTGLLPTQEYMNEKTEEITSTMATQEDVERVAVGLSMYRDSLQRLRKHLDTTLVDPGLRAVVDLQKRMARMESSNVATRIAIEESRQQGQRSTEELIAQMNRQSSADAREKAERERNEREQRERDRALMEAIAKKLKIDTKTF